MGDPQKPSGYRMVLGGMNLIGGLIHLGFEFFLWSNDTVYRGFLLIENLLIAFVFIYFGWSILFDQTPQKRRSIRLNCLFWLFFSIAFLVFQPEVTSLEIAKNLLPLPQKHLLVMVGITALIFSMLAHGDLQEQKAVVATVNRLSNNHSAGRR